MADVVVNAEVKSNIGQLNRDLKKTNEEAVSLKDAFGVAGSAISAAQGAMKLFGIESESTQKAILQVQAAMSLNQGIQSLLKQKSTITSIISLVGKWTGATKLLGVVQKGFNLIVAANPIGAIVAGVTALIALGTTLVSVFKSNNDEVEIMDNTLADINHTMGEINKKQIKQQPQLDANKRIIDDQTKSSKERLDALKENFEIQKAIDAESMAALQEKLVLAKEETRQKESSLNFEKKQEASAETINDRQNALNTAKKNQQAVEAEILKLQNKQNESLRLFGVEQKKITREFFTKAFEAAKKRNEANKKAYEERIAAEKNLQVEISKIEDEITLQSIKNEDERAKKRLEIDLENEKERIKKSKASKKVQNELILLLDKQYAADLKAINDKVEEENKEKQKEENQRLQDIRNENLLAIEEDENKKAMMLLEIEEKAELEAISKLENRKELELEIEKKYARLRGEVQEKAVEDQKKIDKDLEETKIALAMNGLKLVEQIAGEGTKIGKAAAVAQATISGTQSVLEAYKSGVANIPMMAATGGSFGFIQAGLAAGFSALQIRKIIAGQGPSGTEGTQDTTETTPAPQMVSGSFDLSNVQAPEPLKAFVVTDEMTSSQNQLANIRRRATI